MYFKPNIFSCRRIIHTYVSKTNFITSWALRLPHWSYTHFNAVARCIDRMQAPFLKLPIPFRLFSADEAVAGSASELNFWLCVC